MSPDYALQEPAPMKLVRAIALSRECDSRPGQAYRVLLACGFTPQHLRTFLQAHLFLRMQDRRVAIETGLYGDVVGCLAPSGGGRFEAVAAALEWSDFDARLGWRGTHGWRPDCAPDFPGVFQTRLGQIRAAVERASAEVMVSVVLPSLPLPPAFSGPTYQGNSVEFVLRKMLMEFAAELSAMPGVRVAAPQTLDLQSPPDRRLDVGSDIRAGFPYTLEHAATLGHLLAELIAPRPPMMGIITDLDDTLWRGILGEDGVEGVSWELPRGTHCHAMYQELLASLAQSGTLVAVATKNDAELVELALRRPDMVISRDRIFPVQAGWGPKSESIRRILKAWNVGADSVLFIDDSPLELAEVSAALPDVQGLRFPVRDDRAVAAFIQHLRDLCGKTTISDEDRLRLASIRASAQQTEAQAGMTPDEFLKTIDAEITLTYNQPDSRAWELINKTNQFNLNGRRLDDAVWRAILAAPDRFLLTVSYKDKFGPLGKIGVVAGSHQGDALRIDVWVMSCRAFSRRIEFQTLKSLFERFGVDMISLDFMATDRNGPLGDFLKTVAAAVPTSQVRIVKPEFFAACPPLYAKVVVE